MQATLTRDCIRPGWTGLALLLGLLGLCASQGAQAQGPTPAPSPAGSVATEIAVAGADSLRLSDPDSMSTSAGASRPLLTPQRDVMDLLKEWIFGRRIEPQIEGTTKIGISWSLLPSLSYNPVYGWALGASITGAGQLGREPMSHPSVLSLSGNYSTQKQVQALARTDFYTPSGNYLIRADMRYLDTNRSTWGLGPIAEAQQEYPMHFRLIRVYATFFRRTTGAAYVGVGYHYDEFFDIEDERAAGGESTPFSEYSGPGVTRTRASGFSLNLLGDTRNNLVNPSAGYYLSGSFRTYVPDLGSDRNWQEFWIDVRLYPHLPPRSNNILAFWIYSWLTFGPAPYLNLPSNGWDKYGRGARGYLQGRIRGANQIYSEAEYRMELTRDGLLGAVVFLNATSTTSPETQTFSQTDFGGGLGVRIKFNKNSRTNLALDRAWGAAGSKGWFMGMTEVF